MNHPHTHLAFEERPSRACGLQIVSIDTGPKPVMPNIYIVQPMAYALDSYMTSILIKVAAKP